jgi:PAS domain S-box-containing protein
MVANPPIEKTGALTAAASSVVLVVSDSENLARQIESYLRNAGHPVRCAWVADLEDLDDVLRRGAPDLLLCEARLGKAPLRDVVALAGRVCPDLPVLLLTASFTLDDALAAHAAGARDVVAHEDPRDLKRLEHVLQREFSSHQHLRALRSTRARLEDFESRHKQLLAGTNDAVAHIQEGILSHVNPAFSSLLGYERADDLLEMPLMDLVCPDQQGKVKEHLKLLAKGKVEGKPLECCLLRKDGSKVNITAQLTSGTVDGESFVEMLIRAEAAQPGAAAAAPAAPAAASDRLSFFDALTAAINSATQQQKQPRAAMLIAVDNYEGLEQRIGFHDAEEAMLQLSNWARSQLGAQDQLFRFSTGELAAIVQRGVASEFEQFGELLVKEIAKQVINTAGHEAHLSLTVTAYPLAGGEQVHAVAGEIAREARRLSSRGGKQFANLGPTAKNSQQEREDARRALQIRKAIEENRLKLAYQSIASLEGDTRQHFDVLVRMIDESGKEQHAAEFLPVAERAGLMRAIDRWVTARALKVLAKRETSEASSLFVKISEDTLKDAEGYLAWLQELFRQRPLKGEEMVFEIQELTLQNHIRKAKVLYKGVRELGGLLAIEHFGVGTNSAQLLEHVPAQFVKFHPSFTRQFNDKELQKKMTMLMEVARQHSAKTIVSHVEDANVMARLWQMGVNYIQGFHVQEPEVVLLSAEVGR